MADLLVGLHQAILEDPRQAGLYNDLALLLGEHGFADASLRAYRLELQLAPAHPILRLNLGVHYRRSGQVHKALPLFRDLILRHPGLAEAGFNLALLELSLEHWDEGWHFYEQRFALRNPSRLLVQPHGPRWCFGASVKQLWLIEEQGMGDVLHSLRWLPMLRQWASELILVVHPPLVPLLRVNWVADQVLAADAITSADLASWFPLLSVPAALSDLEMNPGGGSYVPLGCPPAVIEGWRRSLRDVSQPLIGLFWQGNPDAETGDYQGRSIALTQLEPLLTLTGISWVALQKHPGLQQLACEEMRHYFINQRDILSRSLCLLDTAAVALLCNLVITTDSALAHLRGCLGVPTWLLLQAEPDWRWGRRGASTVLYPSVRLFRQAWKGDWDGVIQNVRQALAVVCGR